MDAIFLTNVRLSFPHLAEPHAPGNNPNAVKKYSADFLMSPDDAGYKKFMEEYFWFLSEMPGDPWYAE